MNGVHTASSVAAANSVPPFLSKTYDMVDDQSTNSLVSWSDNNNSFVVRNVPEFAKDLLPKYFKHNNFSSFVRQLNTYGFRKVDPDRWEFANEAFLRGQKHLLKSITRRKQPHLNNYQQQPQPQNPSSGSCIEVGKFGLEEEVEILKRDKNVLMQELVKLRQQQQSTDHQLQNVGQRVQIMEQRQQKMMSFLAKAVQSPGFLAQIVQQQNENNRHFSGGNKKRRLPRQEEDSVSSELGNHAPDGRMVKYLPSMNEAAKTLLRQILQMNTSPRRESSVKNPDAFLIDGVPSSHTLDNRSSPIRTSGVTLSEVPPSSGLSYMNIEGEFPMNFPSNGISERQSSSNALAGSVKTAQFLELNSSNDQNTILPDLCGEQRLMSECNSANPDLDFTGSESGNGGNLESMSAILDGTLGLENDDFSGVENMMLPGINDVIWEYFHDVPFDEDRDEVTSISLGSDLTKEQELSEKKREQGKMSKIQNLDHLTEKMGLLASEGRSG